ncbi:MAG: response regulator [Polyangiaceae bacterium]|nr:response regulator [Polyangiaceae bacterium]
MPGTPTTEECLRLLGLDRGATPDDCRRAYKDLVEVWHPDRLAHNERLRRLATDRLKEINEAFAYLMERWKSGQLTRSVLPADARPRVLCVDDDALVLKGLERQLSRSYRVVQATDAQAGLEVLIGDEDVAVILSDLVMPGIDGIALLRQAMIVSPHTTRILLTGHREAVSMSVALDRTFLFKILEKPCGDDLLFETVRQGVEVWRARNARAAGG